MTTQVQEKFLTTAQGQGFDPDRMFNKQCKDLVDAFCMFIFGRPWQETVRPGNGNQVFANANPDYFTKVRNDPNNAGQLPPRGSILSYDYGDGGPGHTALTLAADRNGVDVLQQDGNRNINTERARLGYAGLIGWLIPKLANEGATGTFTRVVTVPVATVRTGPGTNYPPAPAFPNGLAKGAVLAVTGYVSGQDPFPKDGKQDNAWYVTKSGFYVWANVAGNSLAGLKQLR